MKKLNRIRIMAKGMSLLLTAVMPASLLSQSVFAAGSPAVLSSGGEKGTALQGEGEQSADGIRSAEEALESQLSDDDVRVFTSDTCDLVAYVKDGKEGDVAFAGGYYGTEVSFLMVNTDKNVTIRMKEGKSVTTDFIYVPSPLKTNQVRHITLDGVSIDRSGQEIFYQGIDLVTGLSPEARAALYGLYFPGTVIENLSGGTEYAGSIRLTLKGKNVIKGTGKSNIKTGDFAGYTPAADAVAAGIWAMNLEVDGDGSLDVSGPEYGIYVKRKLAVAGGCLSAKGGASSGSELFCSNALLTGGCYAGGGDGKVYGQSAYAGTLDGGRVRLCELGNNTDPDTRQAYPYRIAYTQEAASYLTGLIARGALSQKENGEDFMAAYDMALTCLDGYRAGSSVTLSYGMNYGFDMAQSQAIVTALMYDHPEYWWLWLDRTSPGPGGATLILQNGYSAAKVQSKGAQFEAAVKQVERKAALAPSMSDVQKAFVLYQALAAHVSYDLSHIDQSACSAFLDGEAVCDGYAKAYILLLQRAGIPATYVEGWGYPDGIGVGQGDMHGWVMAKVSGAYYFCDPTWDDKDNTASFANYMLGADAFYQKGHEAHEQDMGYQLPVASASDLGTPADTVTLTGQSFADGTVFPAKIRVVKNAPFRVTVIPAEGKSVTYISAGSSQATALEDEDGSFYADFSSGVGEDVTLSATFRDGSRMSTVLSAKESDLSFKAGDEVRGSFYLKDKSGNPIAGKRITLRLEKRGDEGENATEYMRTTDDAGEASIGLSGLSVGSYLLQAVFAGDETTYRPSSCVMAITVLENIQYEAGDFLIERIGGGKLKEGTDYDYTWEEDGLGGKADGSGLLMIKTGTPVLIFMKDEVSVSHDRIGIDTGDRSIVAHITLRGVVIDRSGITVTGTACDTDTYTPTTKDEKLTAGLFSDPDTQESVITLEGYNELISAGTSSIGKVMNPYYDPPKEVDQETNCYYAAISNGFYTIEGSGSLKAAARSDQSGAYAYGIDCANLTVNSGLLDLSAIANNCGSSGTIEVVNASTYIQNGGEVAVTLGDENFDAANSGFQVEGFEGSSFEMNGGSLSISLRKSSAADKDRDYHAGINCSNAICTGGNLLIDGFSRGMSLSTFGNGSRLSNLTLEIRNAVKPFTDEAKLTIESGLYKEGNAADNTVYGMQVAQGSRVVEEPHGGSTWYRVEDPRGLTVSGGAEGTDYVYADGVFTVKTDTPMTFSMKEGVEKASNRIVASAAGKTFKITLNNVKLDRSEVSDEQVPGYKSDEIILIEKGDLELTLQGSSILTGSQLRDTWESSGSRFGCDNTAILVKEGKITVGGTGSLSIREQNVSNQSAGIVAQEYVQNSGTVDIKTGKEGVGIYALLINSYYGYIMPASVGTGNVTVNGGKLSAVVDGGQSTDPDQGKASGIYADGIFTLNDGEVTASVGETAGTASGLLAIQGITVKKGSLTASSGKQGVFACGIQSGGSLTLSGGKITATGGACGDDSASYGIVLNEDVLASGGELTATGGSSAGGMSIGLEQQSQGGHVNFTGAKVNLQGSDCGTFSAGGKFAGHMLISGGTVTAAGGKANSGKSFGICNDTDSEAVISGGKVIATGSDAALASAGIFESSLGGGVDLKITGGEVIATGGEVAELGANPVAAGIYSYNQLVITGGKIKATGKVKAMDAAAYNISGGAFAEGDAAAGTVYGIKVSAGRIVEKGADAEYPYAVKDPDSGSGQGGSSQGGGSQGGSQDPGQNVPGTSPADTPVVPAVGTKESAENGKGTYEVTGSVKTEDGKEAAEVTYSQASGGDEKAKKLKIPEQVTLRDGSTGVVTAIGKEAFSGSKSLTEVTLPDTVQVVEKSAFSGCKKLKTATLGEGVEKIEAQAFAGCKKLKTINVRTAKLTKKKVGKDAFKNIAKKAVVVYPKNMKAGELKKLKAAFKKGGAPKTIRFKKAKK